MTPTYDDLLDEVMVLRQRVASLSEPDDALRMRAALPLTGKEARLLAALYARDAAIDRGSLWEIVFMHDNGDGPFLKIVDVVVCKVRKKAREGGWPGQIVTIWGDGYRLDQPMREFLSAIVRPEPGALAA